MSMIQEEKNSILKQIDTVIAVRRIRLLGIMIAAALTLIYVIGMLVPNSGSSAGLETLSILSVAFCILVAIASFPVKNFMLEKQSNQTQQAKLFAAHIIAFALCDAGGLFSIVTNLFVSPNMLYATVGFLVSVICIAVHLPRDSN